MFKGDFLNEPFLSSGLNLIVKCDMILFPHIKYDPSHF